VTRPEARIAVAVVWVIAMGALTTWSYTDGAMAAGVLMTLLAGCLIARWWVALIPVVLGLLLIVGVTANGGEAGDGIASGTWAVAVAVVALAIVLLLALGVGLRRAGRVLSRRSR
jgi:hypothetical protein